MPRVSALTLQTLWDCRWSRPGYPAAHNGPPCTTTEEDDSRAGQAFAARQEPGTQWVCIRAGGRRAVSEAECEQCEHWEAADYIDERDERG